MSTDEPDRATGTTTDAVAEPDRELEGSPRPVGGDGHGHEHGDGDGDGSASAGRRRVVRALGWVVAFALWSLLCFVWLFPLLTELGLDPTLGG